jgi:hypothetical protein
MNELGKRGPDKPATVASLRGGDRAVVPGDLGAGASGQYQERQVDSRSPKTGNTDDDLAVHLTRYDFREPTSIQQRQNPYIIPRRSSWRTAAVCFHAP